MNENDLVQANILWKKAKAVIRANNKNNTLADMIIDQTEVKSFENNLMVLEADEKSIFLVEMMFGEMIQNTLTDLAGTPIEVSYVKKEYVSDLNAVYKKLGWDQSLVYMKKGYTFDNFTKTEGNKSALTAVLNAVKYPGTGSNPLFISGGSKEERHHLSFAIVNYLAATNSSLTPIFKSLESLINEIILDRRNNTRQYHEKYDQAEFFVLVDFALVKGLSYVQQELYMILQRMRDENKQVIVISNEAIDYSQYENEDLKDLIKTSSVVPILEG